MSLLMLLITLYFSLSHASTIKRISVDMTYVFDETTLHWPAHKKFQLLMKINQTTEQGYWLQVEEYTSSIHVGTHIDAPRHFSKRGWTVDQIPLSHLIVPAAVIDITHKAEYNADAEVKVEDLKRWERDSGRSLNGTVVLIRSGWGNKWTDRESFMGNRNGDLFELHSPGFGAESAKWLVENRQIYGVGTECLSLDTGSSKDYSAHRILLGSNLYGLENMANMDKIPNQGAILHIMPMKIGGASGAPTRIVAVYPDASKLEVQSAKTSNNEKEL